MSLPNFYKAFADDNSVGDTDAEGGSVASFKHFHMSMPERARDSRLSLMKLMQILLQPIWLL